MQKVQFKNIGVIGRLGGEEVSDTIERVVDFLSAEQYNVIIEERLEDLLPRQLQVSSAKNMGEACDLVVVVGGDGCMLGAGRDLAISKVPVVGINRGNLGFLTDIHPNDVETGLAEVLKGNYTVQPRFLLEGRVSRDAVSMSEGVALNDIVVHPGQAVQMIEFDLYIEGQFVYTQKSDGIIVASPTGSTAYALSAGGPIMHPSLDAIVIVPMFPHMLTSRPIVVNGNSEIKIILRENRNHVNPQVSFDGQPSEMARPGDAIYIRKMPHKLNLIHPTEHDFYETCRSKLGWNRPFTTSHVDVKEGD